LQTARAFERTSQFDAKTRLQSTLSNSEAGK
jgi:hypothetical protein